MKKILLEVQVNDQDLDSLQAELQATEKDFKDVTRAADNTSKSVDDVASNGGAIAVLDNLTGGLATRFKDAFEASRLFNLSLGNMRVALIATGIGALVVAMGLLVVFWKDIEDFVTGTTKKLKEQTEILKTQRGFLAQTLATNELIEKSLIAQGKSTDEILIARDKILKAEQLIILNQLENLRQLRAILLAKAQELSLMQKLGEQALRNEGIEIGETKGTISAEDRKALDEFNKEIKDLTNNLINLGIIRGALARGDEVDPDGKVTKRGDDVPGVDSGLSPFGAIKVLQAQNLAAALAKIQDESLSDALFKTLKWQQEDEDAAASHVAARLALQSELALGIGAALGAIGQLFEQGTAASKIAAIAEIAIGTGVGFINALKIAQQTAAGTTGPLAAFTFPIFYATQIASVLGAAAQAKQILSTVKGGGGFGGVGGGRGGANIPTPDFNIVGDTGVNQLGDLITDGFDKAQRSFVVFGDIKKASQIDRESIRESTV